MYKIFRYLQNNLKRNPGRIAFDPKIEYENDSLFLRAYTKIGWVDFYPDASEVMPRDLLEPLVKPVIVRVYVDANHAGNLVNRRSHSGILIYVSNAVIICYSKRQNIVESSSLG